MSLGISGAAFVFGTLNDWQYYILGALVLAAGWYLRFARFARAPKAVSLAGRRRTRWTFPLSMVISGGAAYALISFVALPWMVSSRDAPTQVSPSAANPSIEAEAASAAPGPMRLATLRIVGMT